MFRWFVSGYIFFSIYLNITGRKNVSQTDKFIWSIVYSFTLHSCLLLFKSPVVSSVVFEIGLSIILAATVGKINQSQWFKNAFVKCFNRTATKEIWEDVIDLSKDNVCRLELKDGRIISGMVKYIDSNKDGANLAITNFIVEKDDEELYRISDDETTMVIQSENIVTTTILYCDR